MTDVQILTGLENMIVFCVNIRRSGVFRFPRHRTCHSHDFKNSKVSAAPLFSFAGFPATKFCVFGFASFMFCVVTLFQLHFSFKFVTVLTEVQFLNYGFPTWNHYGQVKAEPPAVMRSIDENIKLTTSYLRMIWITSNAYLFISADTLIKMPVYNNLIM